MLDWLRDIAELREYPAEVVLLMSREQLESFISSTGAGVDTFIACQYNFVGWMPIGTFHYNQWKAERSKTCPECEGTKGEYQCFDCYGMPFTPSWTKCPACNGTGTVVKKEIDE